MIRKLVVLTALAAFLAVAAMQSTGAAFTTERTMYVTFDSPVSLPGVALGTGTYIFEQTSPDDVVRVFSKDRHRLYFQAFTLTIDRPAGLRSGQVISFGEAPAGGATPIKAWYPEDQKTGHTFMWNSR